MTHRRVLRPAFLLVCAVVLAIGVVAVRILTAPSPERAAPQLRATPLGGAGEAEGEGAAVLGLIGDVAPAGAGGAYLLDVARKRIVAVDSAGGVRGTFGRRGAGPGEFEDPIALAADGTGRIHVLDRVNQRVEVVQDQGGRLARTGSFPLDFPAEDLCWLNGALYLLGERDGRLIHQVEDGTGRVRRSLAPDPGAVEPLTRTYHSAGYLLCGPGDEVAFLPLLISEVRRYRASSGAALGVSRIPGYHAVRVRRLSAHSVRFEAPEGGKHDYASSIVTLPGGDRLLQVGFIRPGSTTRHEFETLRSYSLSARDGSVRELGDGLPRIVAMRGDTAFATASDPFPSLRLLRIHADGTVRRQP